MKTIRTLAATLVIGMSVITAASAQPNAPAKGITIKKLPAGMTQDQFRQRISAAIARHDAETRTQKEQTEREAKMLFEATAQERNSIQSTLNSDPRYKSFMDEARRISSGKGTNEEKAEQLKSLSKQNQTLFSDALKRAKIDRSAFQAKLQKIVPGVTVTSDFTVKKSSTKKAAASAASSPSTLSTQEIVLRPPFSFEDFDSDNQGIAYSDATATPDADDGRAKSKVVVVGLAGGGSATAKFGEFITVPAGVKRVELIVKAKTSYSGNALGAIGTSAAQASVEVSVDNTGSNVQGQYDSEYKSDLVLAPIAWYAEMEGGESGDYHFTFNVPNGAREYLIAGRAYAYSVGAGVPGYASANAMAEIDKITVRYHYD
jgi:hypothetical protein